MKESNLICIEGQVDGAVDEVGRSQVEDEDGRCVPVAVKPKPGKSRLLLEVPMSSLL